MSDAPRLPATPATLVVGLAIVLAWSVVADLLLWQPPGVVTHDCQEGC